MPLKPKFEKLLQSMKKKYGSKKGESIFWATMNKRGINPEQKAYFIFGSELKFVGDNVVEGYISTGDLDLVNDVVTPNCMVDMLRQMKGRTIKVDVEHESFRGKNDLEKELNKTIIPVAKITDSALESKGIKVRTELNTHSRRYDEVKGSIKDGFIDAFSIAYIPVETRKEVKDGKTIRRLEKVNLLNVAYTGNPVNTEAGFTDVMLKSITQDFGGIFMEKKDEEKEETSEEKEEESEKETSEEKPEGKEPEGKTEVKSILEGFKTLTKGFEELKMKVEGSKKKKTKPKEEEEPEEETKALKAEIEKMKEEIKGFNEILSKPQFKARVEGMSEKLEKETELKSGTTGPLDYIR